MALYYDDYHDWPEKYVARDKFGSFVNWCAIRSPTEINRTFFQDRSVSVPATEGLARKSNGWRGSYHPNA